MSDDTDSLGSTPGKSYFLHVAMDGTEQRLSREPSSLSRKTHYVRVISVDDDTIVEETTLTGSGLALPYGKGWEHVSGHTWRRTRGA